MCCAKERINYSALIQNVKYNFSGPAMAQPFGPYSQAHMGFTIHMQYTCGICMFARISNAPNYIKHIRDGLVILSGEHPHPMAAFVAPQGLDLGHPLLISTWDRESFMHHVSRGLYTLTDVFQTHRESVLIGTVS